MTLEAELQQARALLRSGRTAEAVAVFERAVRSSPESAPARGSLALALCDLDRLDEAEREARAALERDPGCVPALGALGVIAQHHHDPSAALEHFEAALARRPDFVVALERGAVCAGQLGDHERALALAEAALRVAPARAHARFTRAMHLLRNGRYEEGWLEYEWRFETGSVVRAEIPRPRWDGNNLAGRHILVLAEQGIGDTLQFARFLPCLKEQGAFVSFACTVGMVPLLARTPGIDRWFPIDQPTKADFDVYIPIGSLPGLLGINEQTLPRDVPYVFPEPERLIRWKAEVASLAGFKVGICWQGSPTYVSDHYRSIPLRHLVALGRVDGVQLVSLQKEHGEADIDSRAPGPITAFDGLDRDGGVMADTAAVMQHLDLVITCDTGIAHLAGAMNVPAWVALSTASDWRWLRDRSDSPWYPSVRLFRQKALGDWDDVFAQMNDALARAVAGEQPVPPTSTPASTSTVEVPVGAGELFDKISILRLKTSRITDLDKVASARHELAALDAVRLATYPRLDQIQDLVAELDDVNARIWDIENGVRDCERRGDFGPDFVALAREVYRSNDRRAALKHELNRRLGSEITEVKSYDQR